MRQRSPRCQNLSKDACLFGVVCNRMHDWPRTELGQFDLFLVPVARTESGGVSYEAVIN